MLELPWVLTDLRPILVGEQQQGHFNERQLKKVCNHLLLYSPYFSIWENQVWDRCYHSNLKSNLTARVLGRCTRTEVQRVWGEECL